MIAATRLPGIQFEVVAPPADETLVRMDIAAFVGFAASGPLHLAVMVEDIARFEEVFGSELILANGVKSSGVESNGVESNGVESNGVESNDAESGQPLRAYLAPAVRAFLRNGGRRCWVIRVADVLTAESGLFPLAGLFKLESGAISQALAPARSPGSWSDSLIAGIALRSHPVVATSFSGDSLPVGLSLSTAGEVAPGDLLRFTFPSTGDVYWFFVGSVDAAATASPLSSRRGRLVSVTPTATYWQKVTSPPSPAVLPICERIAMDLFVQNNEGEIWSLADLGFAPAHPRYWGGLPDDTALFNPDSGTPSGLAAEAVHPRFPLAGPSNGGFFLPLGAQTPDASNPLTSPLAQAAPAAGFFPTSGPEHSSASALERDGVSVFGAELFLDRSLAETTSFDLLNEAYFLRYQSATPRRLTGIHAALEVEEATILAVPDAVQRGWFRVAEEPLTAPAQFSPLQHPEWWHFADCNQKQEIPRVSEPPAGQFQPCDLLIIAPPALTLSDLGGGRYSLIWTPLPGAVDYLEEAVDANFATAGLKRQTNSGSVTIFGQPPGSYYYRVRRQIAAVSSDYSNAVAIRIEVASGWQQNPIAGYQDQTLVDVHRALLRMSAARGDLFAVMSMPGHYRERDAVIHASELKATLAGELTALSFGGLYHPWLTGREEDDLSTLRTNPPDGAMAGIIAQRSSNRGPWISPANEKLSGVVALSPAISRSYRQLLQDSQINLIRQEPGGFLCFSAATLSDDEDLLPINVRRLLSFLRKTALLVGNQYVFEPLSDQFRRGVERGFEKLLDLLAQLGAFSGSTANQSFQVVTDGGLNTPEAAAAGRFYVELKVAPSLPLRFLTVRLLQTADRTFVTEGQ